MTYRIVPVPKTRARQFIQEAHRHNEAPSTMQVAFSVGLEARGRRNRRTTSCSDAR